MDNAGFILLSRQTGLQNRLDTTANNVANVNTTGFKREEVQFSHHLVAQRDVLRPQEQKLAFAQDVRTLRDMTNGPLRATNRAFDVAIQGDGFFMLQTPEGIRYTRAGNFTRSSEGQLVSQQGYAVLNPNNEPVIIDPAINDIIVREDGAITNQDQQLGQIGVVQFANPYLLQKTGDNNYRSDIAAEPAVNYRLAQGMLEDSNSNAIRQITNLIEVQRSFSSISNQISSLDELQRNAIRTLGKRSQ
jgi:flagellar basal-body rod protein FlgF